GFVHEYKETFFSLSVGIQAGETDSKVEDYWSSPSEIETSISSVP
ncbi:unnamed protein product, partial [marine sediment metagenome]